MIGSVRSWEVRGTWRGVSVGYAEADALPFFPRARTVPINSTAPTTEHVLNGDYKFWASEVLYTQPGATGLPRDFLGFLRGRGVVEAAGGPEVPAVPGGGGLQG